MKQKFDPIIEKAVEDMDSQMDFRGKQGSFVTFLEPWNETWDTWSLYLKRSYGYDVNNTLTQLDCDSRIVFDSDDIYKAFLRVYVSFQHSTNPDPFLFCPDVQNAILVFQYELQNAKNQKRLKEATEDVIDLGQSPIKKSSKKANPKRLTTEGLEWIFSGLFDK
tara:strand:- start:249 stop:740 length:492 start_codon:yes stop_codon:yes gene_type:complete